MRHYSLSALHCFSGGSEDGGEGDSDQVTPLTVCTDLPNNLSPNPLRTPKSPKIASSLKKRHRAPGSHKPEGTRVLHTHGRRTLYTAGRPPWYNKEGQLKNAFVIGE